MWYVETCDGSGVLTCSVRIQVQALDLSAQQLEALGGLRKAHFRALEDMSAQRVQLCDEMRVCCRWPQGWPHMADGPSIGFARAGTESLVEPCCLSSGKAYGS